MKVAIIDGICQGHARCESFCPEVFGLHDDGFAFVKLADVPAEYEKDVLLAQANCPERAISVEAD